MTYSKYAGKAYSKIKQYGSPVKITRSGSGVYNSATNSYEGDRNDVNGYALQSSFDQNNIDGTNVRIGDIILLAALDGVPKSNDTVVFCGKSYTAVSIDVLSPDGKTDIYYRIQAR